MKVVFRVDASLLIGSGHVMRCLVLANELRRKGHEIRFACTPFTGDMRSFILERGFDVLALPEPREVVKPAHDADYEAWLQKSVDEDADDFLRAVSAADLVITDHYAIGEQWQKRVKASLGCRLLAIDDLARHHRADLILIKRWDVNKPLMPSQKHACWLVVSMPCCREVSLVCEKPHSVERCQKGVLKSWFRWAELTLPMPP